MSKHARGKLYIDKDVQRALIWQLFRHWALFVAILTGMLFCLEALQAGPNQSWSTLWQATWNRHAPLFLVVFVLFPVFAYDSIKLSHRFVGPIMRLRRALRQAALGEHVPPLQFREGDFWQDLAGSFNTLLERLPPEASSDDTSDQLSSAKTQELAFTGAVVSASDSRGGCHANR